MKTFIRRPGNKTRHLKHIVPNLPKFTGNYIEPFLGTGALYLHLLPKKAILNDLNEDIINIWKLVKTDPEYIITEIDKFKKTFLHKTNEEKLKHCKNILKNMDTYTGKKRTILYLMMVYCSFTGSIILNGKWRTSSINGNLYSKNQCHVFTSDYKEKIRKLSEILKNIFIYSTDYSEVLKTVKKGDFVFLDPPYIEDKVYAFNYNKSDNFDIQKLKTELDTLSKNKVKWMMTQIDTTQVRNFFQKYKFYEYSNNSNFLNGKKSKKELIITNY